MSNAITELSKLNFDGIEWVTELKNKLCQKSQLTQGDIEIAFTKILSKSIIKDLTFKDETIEEVKHQNTLYRLSENVNVAGLADRNNLTFSPILTIVYGKNGTGKSSYYKILKDAFHSKQDLIGNIYTGANVKTTAKIDFVNKTKHLRYQRRADPSSLPTVVTSINWNAGVLTKSKIKFCDQEVLNSSLSKKDTGWSLDRYKLGYYDTFREALIKVEALVDSKIKNLTDNLSEKYNFIINNLYSEEPDSIKKNLLNNKDNGQKFIEILKEISILKLPENFSELYEKHEKNKNLSVKELIEKNELLKGKNDLLNQLLLFCNEKFGIYNEFDTTIKKIERLKKLKSSIEFKKLEQFKLLFNPLSNADRYIELITKIADTAIYFGFKDYPEGINKCFYCNQTLTDENKLLIQEIHKLIDNTIKTDIEELNSQIKLYTSKLNALIDCNTPSYRFSEIGEIYYIKSKEKVDINSLLIDLYEKTGIKGLKEKIDNSDKEITNYKSILEDLELIKFLCNSESILLNNKIQGTVEQINNIETTRKKAQSDITRLQDTKFCVDQKIKIDEIISSLTTYWQYKSVKNQFQGLKTKVSKDKGRVEDELIRKDYLTRFDEHLKDYNLANRDKILRPFSNPDGKSKISAKIESKNKSFDLNMILSEGEAKVYSICDWFTELEFDDNEIVVFDDPITSLDQSNIQKTVEKIISLCNNYQVIVFTHNFEFYHRLIQKSLGGSPLQKGKCEICDKLPESDQCIGFNRNSGLVHKCGTYYQIEYIRQPGFLNEEVMFLSLDWEPRLEVLRDNLVKGDIREADKHLRTTINNFFERYILNDLKRKVYKNNDLIKEWRDIKPIDENDYNDLMDVHNKVSGEGTIHESSPEVRTTMDVRDYIIEFNKTVKTINKIRCFNNASPPKPIAEIVLT